MILRWIRRKTKTRRVDLDFVIIILFPAMKYLFCFILFEIQIAECCGQFCLI